MNELFIRAIRGKYRFSYKGMITVEDLFDLNAEGLNSIYKDLKAELKDEAEDSLLSNKTTADKIIEDKIEIVKYIFNLKKSEAEARLLEKDKKDQIEKLLAIKAAKQEEELRNMSVDDIDKMIEELKQK